MAIGRVFKHRSHTASVILLVTWHAERRYFCQKHRCGTQNINPLHHIFVSIKITIRTVKNCVLRLKKPRWKISWDYSDRAIMQFRPTIALFTESRCCPGLHRSGHLEPNFQFGGGVCKKCSIGVVLRDFSSRFFLIERHSFWLSKL